MADPVTDIGYLAQVDSTIAKAGKDATNMSVADTEPQKSGADIFKSKISKNLLPSDKLLNVIYDSDSTPSFYKAALPNFVDNYVGYSDNCASAAQDSLAKFTKNKLYKISGSQPCLYTFVKPKSLNEAKRYSDVIFVPAQCDEIIGYITFCLLAGLPAYIGVNESGIITPKKGNENELANDWVTDHYLLIIAYDAVLRDDFWLVQHLYGLDNAFGGSFDKNNNRDLQLAVPVFNVERQSDSLVCGIRKNAIAPHEDEDSNFSVFAEYQLTQVYIYEKHLSDARNRAPKSAWKLK